MGCFHSTRSLFLVVTASTSVVVGLLWIFYPSRLIRTPHATFHPWSPTVVHHGSFGYRNENFDCKTAVLMNMSFPVCHYTAETDYPVTVLLLRGQYHEKAAISRFIRLLRLDQRLQLVDIGANVGLWSLPAARVTQVLAVEPNWHSISRFAKAIDLGAVSSNVTLVHNAVSNVRGMFHMGVDPKNQAVVFLINTTKCKRTPIGQYCNTLSPIKTILLNDLLPLMRSKTALMKVDVEGHEVNVFTNSSAGKFFEHINVPLVFMEWKWCKTHPVDTVHRLLHFFYSRNYTAVNENMSKLKKHYQTWPNDILFKKQPMHFSPWNT